MNIIFLSGLKEIVGQEEWELEYEGRLSGLLETLCEMYGKPLRRLLFDSDTPGGKNTFVKILVNGRDVREDDPDLSGEETLYLFLPLAGG